MGRLSTLGAGLLMVGEVACAVPRPGAGPAPEVAAAASDYDVEAATIGGFLVPGVSLVHPEGAPFYYQGPQGDPQPFDFVGYQISTPTMSVRVPDFGETVDMAVWPSGSEYEGVSYVCTVDVVEAGAHCHAELQGDSNGFETFLASHDVATELGEFLTFGLEEAERQSCRLPYRASQVEASGSSEVSR
ncbi:MAG: hypothetical protein Q8P27_03305 [Candidatus Peregrinibacteria bacterium]|nr:hypothetical protein [Candidatus Peregrinibacteria bacterium]